MTNHIADNNVCSARAIFKELGYAKWANFNTLIRRACQMIAHGVAPGSIKETTTSVTLGSGAIRHVVDYELDSQARDLVCLLAASFKLNGHHIARNETAILGLVKKWCEQRGLPARHQKNVCGFYVDMQVGDSLSIEFDEPHHAYRQLADRRRTMVIEKSGSKVIRFGLDCDVIDIITEIERLIPASKMVNMPITTEVRGQVWHLFTFDYMTQDGMFSGYLHALDMGHAEQLLSEMCASAVLAGQMIEAEIPAHDK